MNSLLAIEWLKLKKYNTFWVLTAFFVVLLPLWNYCILSGVLHIGGNGINLLSQTYSFPAVWGNIGFWGTLFAILLAILFIIITTNEYTFRTHRQNVIDGWSRLQFFHAHIYLLIVFSFAASLYVFITGTIFGYVNSGSFSSMFTGLEKVFYFFLFCLNYLGFAMLIGIWFRRSGLSIGMFLLYIFVIKNILKGILNYRFDSSEPGNYLPLQPSGELLPFPLFGLAKQLIKQVSHPESGYVMASIAWCIIFYFVSRRILLKRDW